MIASLAVFVTVVGLYIADPMVAVVHHDDGIYLATAKALAEGKGYRLINLPGEPLQTKYPPVYPLLLSIVWYFNPEFPQNLPAIKAINAAAIGLIVIAAAYWLHGVGTLSRPERIAAVSLLGTSPILLAYSNLVLSEPLFIFLALSCLSVCHRARSADSSTGLALLMVGIVALAMLTRMVGIAFAVAVILHLWRTHRTAALVVAAGTVLVIGSWTLWSGERENVGILLQYYVEYEPSVHELWAHPRLVIRHIWHTGEVLVTAAYVFAGGGMTGRLFLLAALAGAAVSYRDRIGGRLELVFVATYLAVVLDHPMPVPRYVLPLLPFAVLWLVVAMRECRAFAGVVAWVPIVVMLATNIAIVSYFVACSGRTNALPWAARSDLDQGFLETAAWVKQHTEPGIVLASSHDTFYFLYANRQGVRPWLHNAHYYALREDLYETLGSDELLAELRNLRVQCLIRGPVWTGTEGDYARDAMAAVLKASPQWELAFRPATGPQEVFCLRK